MPYPDSDTIPVNTDKNKKKSKLQNQYALLSDDDDDDPTAASTDSSTTSLRFSILHKTTSTNKKKSKKKTTFTSNCNHKQEEWLSVKKDPLRAASFLSHPATHRRNIYERRANEKKPREKGTSVSTTSRMAHPYQWHAKTNPAPLLSNSPTLSNLPNKKSNPPYSHLLKKQKQKPNLTNTDNSSPPTASPTKRTHCGCTHRIPHTPRPLPKKPTT
jgi:hypothetical protein